MNRLAETVRGEGSPLIGTSVSSFDPVFVEIAAAVGFRVLWIEMEHSAITLREAEDLCRLASAFGMLTLIRIPDSRRETVLKTAECGPDIICLAMVNSPETAEELVRHARYAPEGSRGWSTGSRAMRYGLPSDPAEQQRLVNSSLCLMAQIETPEAVARADEIARVPGIDAVFIGLGDLSSSMGLAGRAGDPAVVEAASGVIQIARGNGRLVAVPAKASDSGMWAGKGVDVLICGSIIHCLRTGAQSIMKEAREGLR
ncbi:MAG: aldolase/citrate lyase family protein [Armatimonadetes bacterium]|nr:aldolase/citrate lyase family protein [Armatimonadota bacterium]